MAFITTTVSVGVLNVLKFVLIDFLVILLTAIASRSLFDYEMCRSVLQGASLDFKRFTIPSLLFHLPPVVSSGLMRKTWLLVILPVGVIHLSLLGFEFGIGSTIIKHRTTRELMATTAPEPGVSGFNGTSSASDAAELIYEAYTSCTRPTAHKRVERSLYRAYAEPSGAIVCADGSAGGVTPVDVVSLSEPYKRVDDATKGRITNYYLDNVNVLDPWIKEFNGETKIETSLGRNILASARHILSPGATICSGRPTIGGINCTAVTEVACLETFGSVRNEQHQMVCRMNLRRHQLILLQEFSARPEVGKPLPVAWP